MTKTWKPAQVPERELGRESYMKLWPSLFGAACLGYICGGHRSCGGSRAFIYTTLLFRALPETT